MKNTVEHPNSVFVRKIEMIQQNKRSDRMDALVNLFYTQALQYLMAAADRQPDSRLPIPERFILDNFSTNTVIPEFDKIFSVIRSWEIYVSLIVQSPSQLEDLYGHAKAQTIINNCGHCLYLGGTDTQTARYFAEKFNCQVSTVLNLPLDSAFLFTRGRGWDKEANHCTRMTLGQYLDALETLAFSGDEAPGLCFRRWCEPFLKLYAPSAPWRMCWRTSSGSTSAGGRCSTAWIMFCAVWRSSPTIWRRRGRRT